MKRYVKVERSPGAVGKTTAKVTLVDEALVSVYATGTHLAGVAAAVSTADRRARMQMEAALRAVAMLEPLAEGLKRYVKVERSVAGKTTAKITLVLGEIVAAYTDSTVTGGIAETIRWADKYARQELEAVQRALDELEQAAEVAA